MNWVSIHRFSIECAVETMLRLCGRTTYLLKEEDRSEALPYMVRKETGKIACCCEGEEVVLCDDNAEAMLLWLVLFYLCFQF